MSGESKPPPVTDVRTQEKRRAFLKAAAVGAGVVGFALCGAVPVLARKEQRLRPPGALDERDFLASCIKCGQCVQVCPVEALHPGDIFDGFGIGAPHIDPRKQSCDFACDVGQCILACPTGALTYDKPDFLGIRTGAPLASAPELVDAEKPGEPLQFKERMGVARLARPEACLSVLGKGVKGPARGRFHGLKRYAKVDRWKPGHVDDHPYDLERCDLCMRECPIRGAISIVEKAGPDGATRWTPEVHEACVGCGTCEMMCPAEPAAIVIDPRQTWEPGT